MNPRKKPDKLAEKINKSLDNHQYEGRQENWTKLYEVLNSDETRKYFDSVKHAESERRRRIFYLMRVAAGLAVLIGLALIFRMIIPAFDNNTLATSNDTIIKVVLPDASIVWLNKSSSLSYPDKFPRGEREVFLSGEAYFKVSHDPEKPFRVRTSLSSVEVLGTEFNVKARPHDRIEIVSVFQGKVKVSAGRNKEMVLTQLEKCMISTSDTLLHKSMQPVVNDFSWKTYKFSFDDTPIYNVLESIESSYGCAIITKGTIEDSLRLSATYTDMNLNEIMNTICLTLDLNFEIINDTLVVSK